MIRLKMVLERKQNSIIFILVRYGFFQDEWKVKENRVL